MSGQEKLPQRAEGEERASHVKMGISGIPPRGTASTGARRQNECEMSEERAGGYGWGPVNKGARV